MSRANHLLEKLDAHPSPSEAKLLVAALREELEQSERQADFFSSQWRWAKECERRYIEAEMQTRNHCGEQIVALKGKILGLKAQIANQSKGIARLQRKLANLRTKLIFAEHREKDARMQARFLQSQMVK
jgi:predicted RNase H-like nuclease (RuvC/YqgF family)